MSEDNNDKYLNALGTYRATVMPSKSNYIDTNKDGDKFKVDLPVQVTTPGPYEGKVTYWEGWLTDKAIDNTTKRLAEVLRFNGDYTALEDGSITFEGIEVEIEMERDSYNGKDRYRVKWLNSPDRAGSVREYDKEKAKSLFARIAGRTKAVAKEVLGDEEEEIVF